MKVYRAMEPLRASFKSLAESMEMNLEQAKKVFADNEEESSWFKTTKFYKEMQKTVTEYREAEKSDTVDSFILGNLRNLKLTQDKWIGKIDLALDSLEKMMREGEFLNYEDIILQIRFIILVAKNIPDPKIKKNVK